MEGIVIKTIDYKEKSKIVYLYTSFGMKSIKALDVLPYHDMAIPKYENLGIDYPLKGVLPLTKEQALEARGYILDGFKAAKDSEHK